MIAWYASDRCKLDGESATVLCVYKDWAWVLKDKHQDCPEAVAIILLEL